MTPIRLAVFATTLAVIGCSEKTPTVTVAVIDASLSIAPRAEKAALSAAQGEISRLGRGDSLVLIPITGDAQNDAGGRILRLQAPLKRESYDADLRKFREDAEKRFAAWTNSVKAQPSRTDILGAIDIAVQELGAFPKKSHLRLVIVSDFIQDDARLRFGSDPALADSIRARALADRLRAERALDVGDIPICLGRLESGDYGTLAPARKEAINAFWQTYLAQGSQYVPLYPDGLGLLENPSECQQKTAGRR